MSSLTLLLFLATLCAPQDGTANLKTPPKHLDQPPVKAGDGYAIWVSTSPDRSNPVPLDNAVVSGVIHAFTAPDDNIDRVLFYVDNPAAQGAPDKIENNPPFDLGGTVNGLAVGVDSSQWTDGPHQLTAVLEPFPGADIVVTVPFTVQNGQATLSFSTSKLSYVEDVDAASTAAVTLQSSAGAAAWSAGASESWVDVDPSSGTTPQSIDITVDTTGLAVGNHLATVTATAAGHASAVLEVDLTVLGPSQYTIMVSTSPDRSNPQPLHSAAVGGDIYAFTTPDDDIDRVSFWIDDPAQQGPPDKVENWPPYDLGGTHGNGNAGSFDTTNLSDGAHSLTAVLEPFSGADIMVTVLFTVNNTSMNLVFSSSALSFDVNADAGDVAIVQLLTNTGTPANYGVTASEPWLGVQPSAGTTPANLAVSVDATGLAAGDYDGTITATAPGFNPTVLDVQLTVQATDGSADYGLMVSTAPDRSAPVPLDDQTLAGDVYIFLAPDGGLDKVSFYLDNTDLTDKWRTENYAPYDFNGGSVLSANAYDTANLADGPHTISTVIEPLRGSDVIIHTPFTVSNATEPGQLLFTPAARTVNLQPGDGPTDLIVTLSAADGSAAAFTVDESAPWLTVAPQSGTTPQNITLTVDPDQPEGQYDATVTASATGYIGAALDLTMIIGEVSKCTPIRCDQILVSLPHELDFDQDHGFILDVAGNGTGFTYVDPTSNGTGYIAANLDLDTTAGMLHVTTTAGLNFLNVNDLDNGLAVGIDAPSQATSITTVLGDLPIGQLTGEFQQAGLWWGSDEDNYVKLAVLSAPAGVMVEMLMEVGGQVVSSEQSAVLTIGSQDVALNLLCDPVTLNVTGSYRLGGGDDVEVDTVSPPEEMFSFDAAGIDPAIGTRTFGGLFASHRNGPGSIQYTFEEFSVVEHVDEPDPPDPPGAIDFDEQFVASIDNPTALAWGPDDRLYVTELHGTIHALSFDTSMQVVGEEIIDTLTDDLGPRLTLGITVDPESTADDVTLWVSHSSPSKNNGEPNSSEVTRIWGASFQNIEHTITGLPRALANHAINGLHFGPDGRLYIAMGGNTGAGAPNNANSEFGTFEEQPLSAALVVADVKAPGFDGTCHNANDLFGPPPCDVVTYSTGLRNMYDFTFHSNGEIYATDNGLGVTGTYPPTPTAPCTGFGDPDPWDQGGHNPGTQPDLLLRLLDGKYYGHPNPHRDECVFKDGSYQGAAPVANYEPPMYDLGDHRSSNGIIEYTAPAFCGAMQGDLLVANYSVGDNIVRLELSADGATVKNESSLARGLGNPLPLALAPNGTIFVGEFGASKVSAFVPQGPGCWATRPSVPASTLDPGSAVLRGELYSIAGKTPAGPMSSVYVYDPVGNDWRTAAPLPGPGVENPACVTYDDKIYAFGGSTLPFSGATTQAAAYDADADDWTVLAPMPTPRGGASAVVLDDLIYVIGGMGGDGASVATVEVYDPAADDWTSITPMDTPRDNPGSAAIGDAIFVFGGRTRLADGTELDPTLSSVERYRPALDDWDPRAAMPTGRRTFALARMNGRVQIMGGEKTPAGNTFPQNEEYNPDTNTWRTLEEMPTGRHGMAFGVIDGRFFTAGGGANGGGSYSSVHEVFTLP